MILQIAGFKGGVGKTTIAASLSVLFEDVLLVDSDPNNILTFWAEERRRSFKDRAIDNVQINGVDTGQRVFSQSKRYKNVIVDIPGVDPYRNIELTSTLNYADISIFPIKPEQFDVWTVKHIVNTVEVCKAANRSAKAYILVCQAPTNIKVKNYDETCEALLGINDLVLMDTVIHSRTAYSRANSKGMSVAEMDGRADEKAKLEIVSLYNEILEIGEKKGIDK